MIRRTDGEWCRFYRDQDGYCHLTNRCWDGKPCPRSQAEADAAREALCEEILQRRDG